MKVEYTAIVKSSQKIVTWIENMEYDKDLLNKSSEYRIIKIVVKEESAFDKCEGCQDDQPNQMAHMDCPDGCLHDSSNCGFCD